MNTFIAATSNQSARFRGEFLPVSICTARWLVHAIDFVEFHRDGAHRQVFHKFLSLLSNTRSDTYHGQSVKNRLCFFLRVFKAVRAWGKAIFLCLGLVGGSGE